MPREQSELTRDMLKTLHLTALDYILEIKLLLFSDKKPCLVWSVYFSSLLFLLGCSQGKSQTEIIGSTAISCYVNIVRSSQLLKPPWSIYLYVGRYNTASPVWSNCSTFFHRVNFLRLLPLHMSSESSNCTCDTGRSENFWLDFLYCLQHLNSYPFSPLSSQPTIVSHKITFPLFDNILLYATDHITFFL